MGSRFLGIAVLFGVGAFAAGVPEMDRAQRLYNHTNFTAAAEELLPVADRNAAASELLGQCYFMLGEYKKATDTFERALALDASKSEYFHWLGRAYGRRAETSFPVTAVGYASKARG